MHICSPQGESLLIINNNNKKKKTKKKNNVGLIATPGSFGAMSASSVINTLMCKEFKTEGNNIKN